MWYILVSQITEIAPTHLCTCPTQRVTTSSTPGAICQDLLQLATGQRGQQTGHPGSCYHIIGLHVTAAPEEHILSYHVVYDRWSKVYWSICFTCNSYVVFGWSPTPLTPDIFNNQRISIHIGLLTLHLAKTITLLICLPHVRPKQECWDSGLGWIYVISIYYLEQCSNYHYLDLLWHFTHTSYFMILMPETY